MNEQIRVAVELFGKIFICLYMGFVIGISIGKKIGYSKGYLDGTTETVNEFKASTDSIYASYALARYIYNAKLDSLIKEYESNDTRRRD